MRAKEKGIAVDVIFNASIMTAVGLTGLELYKFGKTTSIPFPTQSFNPETAYEVIKMNKANGLHTLILLDLRPEQDKYMTVNQAISILLGIEDKRKEKVFNEDTLIVGCARLGNNDYRIKSGTVQELMNKDFGKPLHCLVVVGNLHFMEEEALKQWK
jgi:diphthine synthase